MQYIHSIARMTDHTIQDPYYTPPYACPVSGIGLHCSKTMKYRTPPKKKPIANPIFKSTSIKKKLQKRTKLKFKKKKQREQMILIFAKCQI